MVGYKELIKLSFEGLYTLNSEPITLFNEMFCEE